MALIGFAGAAKAEQTSYRPTDIVSFPPILIDAVTAAEDPDYWDDQLWQSPITAQVVRLQQSTKGNDHLNMIISGLRLDWEFSRSQLMALYLNSAYFGRGCYGAKAAAMKLFDKDVLDINTTEAIMLASLLRRPAGGYTDDAYMRSSAQRITTEMVEMGMIDTVQAAHAITEIQRRNMPLRGC